MKFRPDPGSKEGRDYIKCKICSGDFQAITCSHLVFAHRFDPEHPIDDYKQRFGLPLARCLQSLYRLRRGIRTHFERLGRRWTRERVKREILSRHRKKHSLTGAAVNRTRLDLMMGAVHCFGSWAKAVSACGLNYDAIRMCQEWTREKIVRQIRELAGRGEAVNYAAVRRRGSALLQAGRLRFGKWSTALRHAGIDPRSASRRREWTRRAVIRAIRELPKIVLSHVLVRTDPGLLSAARKSFKTWELAVRNAGLEYPEVYQPRKWPRPRILETIRERARAGQPLQSGVIEEELNGLWEAGCREFGNWRRAVEAAGVEYPRREWSWKWPRERVLESIRERLSSGASLEASVVRREKPGLVDGARRGFRNWASAVDAARRSDHRSFGRSNLDSSSSGFKETVS